MPFRINLSDTVAVDSSIVQAYDASFMVELGQAEILSQFVTYKADIGAKSISIPKFARLAVSTAPLSETDDVDATKLSDTSVILTPREHGRVVSKTALASLQTGGVADLAAARVVALDMGATMDALFLEAAYTTANNQAASELSYTTADQMFSKLARKNVRTINGAYVAVAHEDDLKKLRADSAWQDVQKYAAPGTALTNEVGMVAGIRFVRHNAATVGKVIAFGDNAIGKASSQPGGLTMTGPFDSLGRFVNIGWYSVVRFGIIEADAIVSITA